MCHFNRSLLYPTFSVNHVFKTCHVAAERYGQPRLPALAAVGAGRLLVVFRHAGFVVVHDFVNGHGEGRLSV